MENVNFKLECWTVLEIENNKHKANKRTNEQSNDYKKNGRKNKQDNSIEHKKDKHAHMHVDKRQCRFSLTLRSLCTTCLL